MSKDKKSKVKSNGDSSKSKKSGESKPEKKERPASQNTDARKAKPVEQQVETTSRRWNGFSQGQIIKLMASQGYTVEAVKKVMPSMGFAPSENSLRVTYSEGIRDKGVPGIEEGMRRKLRLHISQQTEEKPNPKLVLELRAKHERRGKGGKSTEAAASAEEKPSKKTTKVKAGKSEKANPDAETDEAPAKKKKLKKAGEKAEKKKSKPADEAIDSGGGSDDDFD